MSLECEETLLGNLRKELPNATELEEEFYKKAESTNNN
jgi:hypothetical protein